MKKKKQFFINQIKILVFFLSKFPVFLPKFCILGQSTNKSEEIFSFYVKKTIFINQIKILVFLVEISSFFCQNFSF